MIIAVIDRHPILRIGLNRVLSSNFEKLTILESDNIAHFHELHPEQIPDIIIMGVNQKNNVEDNVGFISKSRKWYPTVSTIVYDEDENTNLSVISQYLKIGVSGYLSKQEDSEKLSACVTSVADGKRYLSNAILLRMLSNNKSEENDGLVASRRTIKLSRREMEIARYLTEGMRTSFIAQKLGRKPSTISTIKKNILTKTETNSVIELKKALEWMQL